MPILLKLYRCFCHDLKICMWFGYYPEIIFCHFFCNLNLVIFKCFYYQSEKIVGTLCAQLHSCFGHGLKICMWFGYNPQIINNNGGGHKFSEFACSICVLSFSQNCRPSKKIITNSQLFLTDPRRRRWVDEEEEGVRR